MQDSAQRMLVDKTKAYFSTLAKPEIVAKYAKYFKEGYDGYGVPDAEFQEYCKTVFGQYPQFTPDDVLTLGDLSFAEGKYELASLAILWLARLHRQFDRTTFEGVHRWFEHGVANWAHSDIICSRITPLFFGKKLIDLDDYRDWRTSPCKWTRRAVPVTMLTLRKECAPDLLLTFLEPMMGDTERVVHQGLGWFLRDLWKVSPEPVEDFLYHYRNTSARLIFQYATEKMEKADRERFRKDKKPR